jgi:tRNA threonylcarbamoyladenosine biosynthesis protein TsaB
VAQGLAAGSDRPVLPIDTLMAVADEARRQALGVPTEITAILDARMNEVYLQHFEVQAGQLQALGPCEVLAPERVSYPPGARRCVAGNALGVYSDRLPPLPADGQWVHALPTAAALLRLAPGLLHQAVPAAQALPLYVRDKVAQTTEERLAAKAALGDAPPHPRARA